MIDFTKPVVTVKGKSVRILCTDGPHDLYPVIGIIEGSRFPSLWDKEGRNQYLEEHNLKNIFEKWLAIYKPDRQIAGIFTSIHNCYDGALHAMKFHQPIACIPISYTEGEGL